MFLYLFVYHTLYLQGNEAFGTHNAFFYYFLESCCVSEMCLLPDSSCPWKGKSGSISGTWAPHQQGNHWHLYPCLLLPAAVQNSDAMLNKGIQGWYTTRYEIRLKDKLINKWRYQTITSICSYSMLSFTFLRSSFDKIAHQYKYSFSTFPATVVVFVNI